MEWCVKEGKVRRKEREVATMQNEIRRIEGLLEQNENENLELEFIKLKESLEDETEAYDALKVDFDRLTLEKKSKRENIDTQKTEISTLKREILELDAQFHPYRSKADNDYQKLRSELNEETKSCDKLNREFIQLNKDKEDLLKELKEIEDEIPTVNKQKTKLESSSQPLGGGDIKIPVPPHDTLLTEEELTKKITELENEIVMMKNKCVCENPYSVDENLVSEIWCVEFEIQVLNGKIAELGETFLDVLAVVTQMKKENSLLEISVESLTEEKRIANEYLDVANLVKNDVEKEVAILEKKVANLTKSVGMHKKDKK